MSGGADKGFSIDPTTVREWKRYPEYTDSGVAWFGEVPAGWELKRLKHISTVNDDALSENTPPDYQILYVDISDVDPVKGIQNAEEMTFEKAPSRARRLVRSGDVIVSTVRTYLRAITPIINPPENLIVSTGFAVIRTNSNFDSKFAGYTLRGSHFIEPVVAKSKGVSYPAINASELVCLEIPLPPLPEQQAIAAFLDRETARIDALIAKKQRFIELLEEKRQALITQAVTKGLDPDVEMKDSGVEWLGEVPVGWVVSRLGLISESLQTGPFGSQLHSSDYIEDGIPVINPSNIRDGAVVPDPKCTVDDKTLKRLKRHRLAEGDIVFARRGDMGRCASINSETEGFLCGTGCIRIRLNQNAYPEFVRAYLSTLGVKSYLLVESVGSTMDNLNTNILSRVPIVSPSFDEQKTIMKNLSARINKVDKIFLNVKESIEKLHEYRTALISAAVTGKIDVRSEVDAT